MLNYTSLYLPGNTHLNISISVENFQVKRTKKLRERAKLNCVRTMDVNRFQFMLLMRIAVAGTRRGEKWKKKNELKILRIHKIRVY